MIGDAGSASNDSDMEHAGPNEMPDAPSDTEALEEAAPVIDAWEADPGETPHVYKIAIAEDLAAEDDVTHEVDDPIIACSSASSSSSAADAALATTVLDSGDLVCAQSPWSELGKLGKRTTFPPEKPLAKRSVSLACKLHRYKCSICVGRSRVTDMELIRWLLAMGMPPTNAQQDELLELGRQHRQAWSDYLKSRI